MSTRNSPPHFKTGIGVYSPWRAVNARVRAAQTATAPKRKCDYKRGVWKEGKLADLPKQPDNRRVRVRGPRGCGWLRPQPMKAVYFSADKGWLSRFEVKMTSGDN